MAITYLDDEPVKAKKITYLDDVQQRGASRSFDDVAPVTPAEPLDIGRQFVGSAVDTALLGLPDTILKKLGLKEYATPEPVTTSEKIASGAGSVVGAIAGSPGIIAGKSMGLLGKLPGIVKVPLSGAITAAAITPESEKGDILQPGERAKQAGGGALLGLAGYGIYKGSQLLKDTARIYKSIKTPVPFLQKVRSAFTEAKQGASKTFGMELERLMKQNPEKTISIEDSLNSLSTELQEQPALASAIRRSPILNKYFENPELAKNITLKESQQIINQIKNKISLSKLRGAGVRPDDIPLFDFVDNLKANQLSAFPEMTQVNREYGKVLSRYNLLKPKLKEGTLLNNIRNNWNDPEIRAAAEELLPKEIISDIQRFGSVSSKIETAKKVGKRAGLGLAAGAAGAVGFKALKQ